MQGQEELGYLDTDDGRGAARHGAPVAGCHGEDVLSAVGAAQNRGCPQLPCSHMQRETLCPGSCRQRETRLGEAWQREHRGG